MKLMISFILAFVSLSAFANPACTPNTSFRYETTANLGRSTVYVNPGFLLDDTIHLFGTTNDDDNRATVAAGLCKAFCFSGGRVGDVVANENKVPLGVIDETGMVYDFTSEIGWAVTTLTCWN